MLTPEQLLVIPDGVVELYQRLEEFIIGDISRRIAKAGAITNTAQWQLMRSREIGFSMDHIQQEIKKLNRLTDQQTASLFQNWISFSANKDNEVYLKAGKKPPILETSPFLMQYVEAATRQTKKNLFNITQSMGFARTVNGKVIYDDIAKYYHNVLDFAQVQISSGVTSYQTAIRMAIKDMCESGLRFVNYESGWSNRVDSAVRRATLTGVNQTAGKISEMVGEQMGEYIYEVTAHAGARPSHAVWQGGWYDIRGNGYSEYKGLAETTGWGTGSGLEGWNCRHNKYVVIPGFSHPAYSDQHLRAIDPPPFVYKDRKYTYYQATQKQREIERTVRGTRLELIGYKEAGDKAAFTTASIKLKQQEKGYDEFSHAAGLLTQKERLQTYGFNRSISQQAVWANKKAQ